MSELREAIQDAADTNARLLAELGETDYAPPALKEQERYIADLDKELKETISNLETKLRPKTNAAKEDSEKYEKSVMKRFAYKATGQGDKFDKKEDEEERKYVEALEAQNRAIGVRDSLHAKLEEAKKAKEQLVPVAKQHADAQTRLDALYEKIFAGPTATFPEEDQKEDVVKNVLWRYQDVQAKLDAEKRVINLLGDARKHCAEAWREVESARSASRADMFGGGMLMDMMERSSLGKAEREVAQFQSLYKQAQQTSPFVQDGGNVQIANGHMWSDMVFDTLGGDIRMHENIKESSAQLQKAQAGIDEQVTSTRRRVKDLQVQTEQVAAELAAARKDLQDARTKAIEQVINSNAGNTTA